MNVFDTENGEDHKVNFKCNVINVAMSFGICNNLLMLVYLIRQTNSTN